MDDDLTLVKPSAEYREELTAYKAETLAIEPMIHGDGGWDECATLEEWLERLKERETEATCPPGYVPASTYLCVRRRDKRLIGFVDIRHRLNDYLLNFAGHIGYSIRPGERGKGYGKRQLALALEKCRELGLTRVLVCCDSRNARSRRVILSQGGQYEDSRRESDGGLAERYWINL